MLLDHLPQPPYSVHLPIPDPYPARMYHHFLCHQLPPTVPDDINLDLLLALLRAPGFLPVLPHGLHAPHEFRDDKAAFREAALHWTADLTQ